MQPTLAATAAHTTPALPSLAVTLARAEAFIAGFEDDSSQEGIALLLTDLRRHLAWARPIAPEVPEEHVDQRYFCGRDGDRWVTAGQYDAYSQARVYRNAARNVGELSIMVRCRHGHATAEGEFTPSQLLEIAARLMDAAHDIETRPAVSVAA